MFTFNLLQEEWLPCVMIDHTLRDVSLKEALLDAHKIRDLSGDSPPVTIALHRLLLAVLHRALNGPKDASEWNGIRQTGLFDRSELEDYFEKWASRFDLFDAASPFYQSISAKEKVQEGAVIQLYFQGKNNATLFDHSTISSPRPLTPAEASRMLIAFQGFDFGGIKADGSAQSAPLLQSAIALVKGESLFETLLLNLHWYNSDDGEPFPFDPAEDLPAWERNEETLAIVRLPDGYVDLLTWQSRRVYLEPEIGFDGETLVRNTVIMRGYSFPQTVGRHEKETMTAFRASNTAGYFPVGFNGSKALWRNSLSILQTVNGETIRPKMFGWLSDLVNEGYINRADGLPIEFYGLASDKAKLLFWQKESFTLPAAYLNDDALLGLLRTGIAFSEEIGFILKLTTKKLSESLETSPDTFPIISSYWSLLESRFHMLLAGIPAESDDAVRNWFQVVLTTANDALTQTMRSLNGSAIEQKAIVAAEDEYRKRKIVLLNDHKADWGIYLPETKAKGRTL